MNSRLARSSASRLASLSANFRADDAAFCFSSAITSRNSAFRLAKSRFVCASRTGASRCCRSSLNVSARQRSSKARGTEAASSDAADAAAARHTSSSCIAATRFAASSSRRSDETSVSSVPLPGDEGETSASNISALSSRDRRSSETPSAEEEEEVCAFLVTDFFSAAASASARSSAETLALAARKDEALDSKDALCNTASFRVASKAFSKSWIFCVECFSRSLTVSSSRRVSEASALETSSAVSASKRFASASLFSRRVFSTTLSKSTARRSYRSRSESNDKSFVSAIPRAHRSVSNAFFERLDSSCAASVAAL
mmetsp:Transcript_14184/g.59759  ORF Transcript_14184/g.59759 Transcript_14184/m.59759 type:complete len:315 (-) Transcript_14184:164-1108(-)